MHISVRGIHLLALLMAVAAAVLSGIILNRTFAAQSAQRRAAQVGTGKGQINAVRLNVLNQLSRMETATEVNLKKLLAKATQMPAEGFESDKVISTLNSTIFDDWVLQSSARGQLFGFGVSFLYPMNGDYVSFDRTIHCYSDVLLDGRQEFIYATTSSDTGHMHSNQITWSNFYTPVLGAPKYNYEWFSFVNKVFMENDFFDFAYPWASSDGNSYWYFTQQRHFQLHGVHGTVQTYDHVTEWRNRMLAVRIPGSEYAIFDSRGMLLAATNAEEAQRLGACREVHHAGVVSQDCINHHSAEHPVAEIRTIYNTLHTPEWDDLKAEPVPLTASQVMLNGTWYVALSQTLFSKDNLRMTLVWYQPYVSTFSSSIGIIFSICFLTIMSTLCVLLLENFGILRPLMQVGQGMRLIASSLKDGPLEDTFELQTRKPNLITEVDAIARDFETIVVDFLGFSRNVLRENSCAPTDQSKPFAVVFTDIESSTKLWGKDPVAMSRCIQVHHELIRELIKKYGLYEVKTIGDSFMITGSSATAALNFAMDLQLGLNNHDWGWDGLHEIYGDLQSDVSHGRQDVWNGLRVRTAVHFGMGDITWDEVAKGYDYYGNVINTCARIEAAAHGGQVLVSEDVLAAASPSDIKSFVAFRLGVHPLRGISEPPVLFQILPAVLSSREFPPLRGDPANAESNNLNSVANDHRILMGPASFHQRSPVNAWVPLSDDLARTHSLVKAGVIPVAIVSRYLQTVQETLEELLVPLGEQQRISTFRTILKGWGIPPPHSRQDISSFALQAALRMSETPRALMYLRRTCMEPMHEFPTIQSVTGSTTNFPTSPHLLPTKSMSTKSFGSKQIYHFDGLHSVL